MQCGIAVICNPVFIFVITSYSIHYTKLYDRDEYLKAPKGYNDSEVFPWKYNREFSFARRFIVKYKNNKVV